MNIMRGITAVGIAIGGPARLHWEEYEHLILCMPMTTLVAIFLQNQMTHQLSHENWDGGGGGGGGNQVSFSHKGRNSV